MNSLLKYFFLENVSKHPDNKCIEVGNNSFTYKQFNSVVNSIKDILYKNNIKNKAVIVLNEHTEYTYASILAVNFSDNIILPLEATWPKQRIYEILKAVKPAAIIFSYSNSCVNTFLEKFTDLEGICLIEASSGKTYNDVRDINESENFLDLAYIIFTSGSTGNPKGVPVHLRNLNAYLKNIKELYAFNEDDRFLQVFDITFDVAYFSFFIPLCYGACCCIVQQKEHAPKFLCIIDDLIKKNISVVCMVPTVINLAKKYIKKNKAESVKYSFFIGDVLHHSEAIEWQSFIPNAEIHNHYGPTEATIACSRYVWNIDSQKEIFNDSVPIGRLFNCMEFKIIDDEHKEVINGIGELVLSGDQVISNYINGVNNEKFFYALSAKNEQICFYKTGDLVSLNERGNLIFHGRVDHQIKLNGYRIELGEIQLAISKVTQRKNIVIKKKSKNNTYFLSVFIEGEFIESTYIKQELGALLPEYMIPLEYRFIDQLPLTENGKIDILYLSSL